MTVLSELNWAASFANLTVTSLDQLTDLQWGPAANVLAGGDEILSQEASELPPYTFLLATFNTMRVRGSEQHVHAELLEVSVTAGTARCHPIPLSVDGSATSAYIGFVIEAPHDELLAFMGTHGADDEDDQLDHMMDSVVTNRCKLNTICLKDVFPDADSCRDCKACATGEKASREENLGLQLDKPFQAGEKTWPGNDTAQVKWFQARLKFAYEYVHNCIEWQYFL
eukprot:COSAG01_NODE_11393_length_1945_cov_116.280333_3_plen_225_part_01